MLENLINSATEKLNKINHIVPNLNCGGCGIFAHALGAELQSAGINCKVVSLGPDKPKEAPDKIVERLKSNGELTPKSCHDNGIQIWHLMVEVKNEKGVNFYIDSTGVKYSDDNGRIHFAGRGCYIDGRMSIEDCKTISDIVHGWNSRFDRSFIPKIYDFVKRRVQTILAKNSGQLTLAFQ